MEPIYQVSAFKNDNGTYTAVFKVHMYDTMNNLLLKTRIINQKQNCKTKYSAYKWANQCKDAYIANNNSFNQTIGN